MPNSYEHSFQHNLDDVIDASDAVLAIGTEKVDTNTLKDRSLNNNDATIHGAMRANGYFDGGRRYSGADDHVNCGNNSSLNITDVITFGAWVKFSTHQENRQIVTKWGDGGNSYLMGVSTTSNKIWAGVRIGGVSKSLTTPQTYNDGLWHQYLFSYDGNTYSLYVDSVLIDSDTTTGSIDLSNSPVLIGRYNLATPDTDFKGLIAFVLIHNSVLSTDKIKQNFNTLARLSLYSHNFERYPNSDTPLTSIFPYTSGIITSGSFNKTDGLKCTSAGQIVFSNSFEFDGSEYITLVVDGVEYSGTTTVTQGTITATIAQGSNDITIDMGTNDVLEDVRVQFRKEV